MNLIVNNINLCIATVGFTEAFGENFMREASSEQDPTPPSGQFDTVSKRVIQQNPEDWIRFALGISEVKVIQILDTEQPTVRAHRADSFIHVDILGKEAVMHFEFQTHDSTRIPMPYRIVGYAGRGIETFQKPVYSHVIYLHPNAGISDPGEYVQDMLGHEITLKYKVIRLSEIEGQAVLDAKLKGLIPFAPLMKPPESMDSGAWLRECVRVADTLPMDEPDKPDYLSSLVILSGLILNFQTIRQIISEETMYESSVIQHFTEQGIKQGIEQGERKGAIESLFDVLDVRFQHSEVQTLKPKIESIEELQTLKQLLREALQVSSLDEFRRILASNGK